MWHPNKCRKCPNKAIHFYKMFDDGIGLKIYTARCASHPYEGSSWEEIDEDTYTVDRVMNA